MKTKSFAMLAASGLLIASISHIAPAMADEFSTEMPMEQTLADNSSGSSMQAPVDNSTSSQSNSASQQSDSNNNSSSSNSSGNEEGSPDTATGDDDY